MNNQENPPNKELNKLCIIPTGNFRWLILGNQSQDTPKKLQMEFRDWAETALQWKDVPNIYVGYDEFFGVKP